MHIALLGNFSIGNIGNDATLKCAITDIKKVIPDCNLSVISSHPAITSYDYQIPVFPMNKQFGRKLILTEKPPENYSKTVAKITPSYTRNLAKSIKPLVWMVKSARFVVETSRAISQELPHIVSAFRHLGTIDVLVICGTGQLQDYWGGTWDHPYSRFKWALLARIRSKKIIILSVGANRITTRLSHFFINNILKHADYISCRDKYSQTICQVAKQKFQPVEFPDLVFNHRAEKNSISCRLEKQKIIGFNTIGAYENALWPESRQEKYNNYIFQLAETIAKLHKKEWKIGLFNADNTDMKVIRDLLVVITERYSPAIAKSIFTYRSNNIDELVPVIHQFDIVVATRFHGILISTLCAKPTIGITVQEKQRDFFKAEGLEMLGIPFDEFSSERLLKKIDYAYENSAEIKNSIKTLLAKNRSLLDQQYKELTKYLRGACQPEE